VGIPNYQEVAAVDRPVVPERADLEHKDKVVLVEELETVESVVEDKESMEGEADWEMEAH